jgi:hypothetical protein
LSGKIVLPDAFCAHCDFAELRNGWRFEVEGLETPMSGANNQGSSAQGALALRLQQPRF